MTSLFIPSTDNVCAADIAHIFQNNCEFGIVSKVDIVQKKEATMAYVHFASWNDTENSLGFRAKIANGETVRVFHNDKRYWNVVANTYTPKKAKVKTATPKAPVKCPKAQPSVVRNLEAEFTEDLVDVSYVRHLENELAESRIYIADLLAEIDAMKINSSNLFVDDCASSDEC
jgi:hypothetical protein